MTIRFLDFVAESVALRDLRMRALYGGRSSARAIYQVDEDGLHIGAYTEAGTLVGCASLFRNSERILQLRGMGTADSVRGTGVGRDIIRFAESFARMNDVARLWCNARAAAVGFYERCGWAKEGAEFDVSGIGGHFVMVSTAVGEATHTANRVPEV